MAVTITLYNHTAKLFANKEVTLTTIKAVLTNSYSFSASETDLTAISAADVDGNGWTTGGETLTSVAVTTATTNDAKLDADDISVTASGGTIGPATGLALIDSTSSKPLAYVDFGQSESAGVGTPFNINWAAGGIFTWTVT